MIAGSEPGAVLPGASIISDQLCPLRRCTGEFPDCTGAFDREKEMLLISGQKQLWRSQPFGMAENARMQQYTNFVACQRAWLKAFARAAEASASEGLT